MAKITGAAQPPILVTLMKAIVTAMPNALELLFALRTIVSIRLAKTGMPRMIAVDTLRKIFKVSFVTNPNMRSSFSFTKSCLALYIN